MSITNYGSQLSGSWNPQRPSVLAPAQLRPGCYEACLYTILLIAPAPEARQCLLAASSLQNLGYHASGAIRLAIVSLVIVPLQMEEPEIRHASSWMCCHSDEQSSDTFYVLTST